MKPFEKIKNKNHNLVAKYRKIDRKIKTNYDKNVLPVFE